MHDPDLLFLDEPTNGMDPKGRDEMLELIHDLAHNKNVNLILSSHLLPDVEFTCDHVVVMDKGTRRDRTARSRRSRAPHGRVYELRVKGDAGAVHRACCGRPATTCKDTDEDVMRVFVPGADDDSAEGAVRRWRRASACRCGTCGRACRRSKTSSPARWERSSDADS